MPLSPATPDPTPLNLTRVRAAFPGLQQATVFLDNAGGSQVLGRVAERISACLLQDNVQLGASYAASQRASERVLAARRAIAEMVNAPQDDEIVMGPATTALIGTLVTALRPSLQPGDEVIVTHTDHEANIGAWTRLAQDGVVLRTWRVNPDTLALDLAQLDALLGPRTRWVAMTQASNILGTVNPVAEAARRVHAVGARLCVDAVAYAPHRLVDVQACGADAVVFSFYKVFGPHYAVMWLERGLLLGLPSLNHYFIGADALPYKLQPGNLNYELTSGCAAVADYLCETGVALGATGTRRQLMQAAFDAFARHEDALAEQLLAWLRARPGVRIIGLPSVHDGERVPTISFVVNGQSSEAIVRRVDAHGIGIRFGDFYARRLIEALGLQAQGGVVRVSIAHYNTAEEIARLLVALEQAID
jgi:cysteine desulfurase family protein (TIGR01976 family)